MFLKKKNYENNFNHIYLFIYLKSKKDKTCCTFQPTQYTPTSTVLLVAHFLSIIRFPMSKLRRDPNLSSERLPHDVVFDILSRLTVKSLMRFRWVSKSWNSIITDPIFITKHLNLNKAKSLSNNDNNGYLLYSHYDEDGPGPSRKDLGTTICNSDRTFTEISRFQIPFLCVDIVGFCNGMFCLNGYYEDYVFYLWNPSIKMFKSISPLLNKSDKERTCCLGFAYHSQNNDYKILRIVEKSALSTEAQVYTLSTDSWRRFAISFGSDHNIGSIDYIYGIPCLFFNGALHALAFTKDHSYSLCFDVNDETFQMIILPEHDCNFYGGKFSLAVFKGSLAMIGFSSEYLDIDICYIWVMREYGVVDSWTKITVELEVVERFFCCVDNGELLFGCNSKVISYDPESTNENDLGITVGCDSWLSYTTDPMESLVLLGQVKMSSEILKISLYQMLDFLNIFSKMTIYAMFILTTFCGMASYMHFAY